VKQIKKNIVLFFSAVKNLFLSKKQLDVRYKIIDISNEKTVVWLQCLQTNAIFNKKISGTTIDLDIIGNLLPEQACFWGILLGEFLKLRGEGSSYSNIALLKGDFFLHAKNSDIDGKSIAFDRFGNLLFIHPEDKEICSRSASDVVLDRLLINSFHPTVACYIGLYVGHKSTLKGSSFNLKTKGHLRLVSNF
jgi:hypothetical protein